MGRRVSPTAHQERARRVSPTDPRSLDLVSEACVRTVAERRRRVRRGFEDVHHVHTGAVSHTFEVTADNLMKVDGLRLQSWSGMIRPTATMRMLFTLAPREMIHSDD